ncbi:MAG: hypothetical protein M1510_03970 [Nitrospirae bacterium]|nr:hypothetical protein [Nitrospirota bacterium]
MSEPLFLRISFALSFQFFTVLFAEATSLFYAMLAGLIVTIAGGSLPASIAFAIVTLIVEWSSYLIHHIVSRSRQNL